MIRLIVVFLTLGFSSLATAIDVSPINKRDQPVVITHDPGETVNAIYISGEGEWKFLPESHFTRLDGTTVMAGPPGQYLLTTGGSTIIKIVDEDGPRPSPNPGPKPDPKPNPGPDPPDPEPEPGPAPFLATWAIWIEEQEERGQHERSVSVMTDPDVRADLIERGIQPRIYDKDQDTAKPFAKIAGDVRPALILMTADAKQTRVFPAPKSKDELETIIRENVIR